MKEFFCDEIITIPYKLFGKTHIFLMSFIIVSLIVIYLNKNKLKRLNDKLKRKITLGIAIILLLNMIILYVSSFYYKIFDIQTMLPLHLCYISNYFYMFAIFFKKENLYVYIPFLSFLGPIIAIIFFDVPSVWESYNFYLYTISHHFFLVGGFLTYFLYPKKIEMKNVINLVVIMNIVYIFISIFNHYFNTNYFYSGGIPEFILNMFPFLNFIHPVIILEICELAILYGLYYFYGKTYSVIEAK